MKSFISLGPTCVPAEILKAAGLRHCTYGFDWFRSGDFFIESFFNMPCDLFLIQFVNQPAIVLNQNSNPRNQSNQTSELAPYQPKFGFNYLYNPHRDYSDNSTQEYFHRAFHRLSSELENYNSEKHFIIADYANKHGSVFLRDSKTDGSLLASVIESSTQYPFLRFTLTVARIHLIKSTSLLNAPTLKFEKNIISNFNGHKVLELNIYLSDYFDNEGKLRCAIYKRIGGELI